MILLEILYDFQKVTTRSPNQYVKEGKVRGWGGFEIIYIETGLRYEGPHPLPLIINFLNFLILYKDYSFIGLTRTFATLSI